MPRRTRYDLSGSFPGKGWTAMKLDKGLVAGSSTLLVLSLLEHTDLYGYQMIEELARRSNDVFQMKEGTLYPILHGLEKGKYLSSYEQQAPTGRMRKYYRLTRRGRELLADKKTSGKLVFVGDGINDAPVLARADIGIAMGGIGSDAAVEAADVVIMTDEPSKIAAAIRISRRTLRIVKQNIVFALGVKGLVLLLGVMGMATMWEAVFADVGVSVIAILNSLRALNVRQK